MSVDQRSISTKKQLRDALVELMSSHPIDKISVRDLCVRANINRTTFYYHYKSVVDILVDVETQMESELIKFLKLGDMYIGGNPQQEFYEGIFSFIQRNSDICKYLLNAQREVPFLTKALEMGRAKVFSDISRIAPNMSGERIEYYYTFVSNGIIGLIRSWLNDGMQESVEEIAQITIELCGAAAPYLIED